MVPSILKFLLSMKVEHPRSAWVPWEIGFRSAHGTDAFMGTLSKSQKRNRAMKDIPARMMSGAALLLLAAATPAVAGHSSKAEIEATRQLNMQAAAQAALPAPQPIAAKDAAANAPDNTPPAAAPTDPIQSAQMAAPAAAAGTP
jgi:hypothetical protein